MLPHTSYGTNAPALVMMPFLGGSQSEWQEVVAALSPAFRCITADLPGFGAAAHLTGYSVEGMADQVINTLRELELASYVLVGHSMAGKVSAVVARRLIDGRDDVPPPCAMVLISPSPPGPEPMTEEKRNEMLAMFGSQPLQGDFAEAEKFLSENTSKPLSETKMRRTALDVVEMSRDAWVSWLQGGSKEDWSEFVGTIHLPVLVTAGVADAALGPSAQRSNTLPHFPKAKLLQFDCGHLAPLELPEELASAVEEFLSTLEA